MRRVEGWRDELVLLHRGPRATVFRPSATLFLLLKVARLSQTDLEDWLALLDHCRTTGEAIDRERTLNAIAALAAIGCTLVIADVYRDALAAP